MIFNSQNKYNSLWYGNRVCIILCVIGMLGNACAVFKCPEGGSGGENKPGMVAKKFTSLAVVLPARSIGKTVIRSKPILAIDIRVEVENLMPLHTSPILLFNEKPASTRSGRVGGEGNLSVLSFIVQDAKLIKDGANLEIQFGLRKKSRIKVPGVFRFNEIRPLSSKDVEKWKGSSVSEWLHSQ